LTKGSAEPPYKPNQTKKEIDMTSHIDEADMFALRGLCDELDPGDKHVKVITAIEACIARGINTRALIVKTLRQAGCDPQHVAIMLREGTGRNPDVHSWHLETDGTYTSYFEPPE
jgi:hypothetical protein